jgi:hypothetical protein
MMVVMALATTMGEVPLLQVVMVAGAQITIEHIHDPARSPPFPASELKAHREKMRR